MRAVVWIPARGGSTRVADKNLQIVGGRSLVQRAIDGANLSGCQAVVSTQDPAIAKHARENGAEVHDRPAELADAFAQIEPSIAHWWATLAEREKPEAIVLRHPTHCFVTREHVREALAILARGGVSTVVGVADVSMAHAFAGECYPLFGESEGLWSFDATRDALTRPRSQDVPKVWCESGSLYAFTRHHWETVGDRMWGACGDIRLAMGEIDSMDIDTPEDLLICRAIAEATGR